MGWSACGDEKSSLRRLGVGGARMQPAAASTNRHAGRVQSPDCEERGKADPGSLPLALGRQRIIVTSSLTGQASALARSKRSSMST